jgi:serine-type D-Ala-D-Ala carboxypeptidase
VARFVHQWSPSVFSFRRSAVLLPTLALLTTIFAPTDGLPAASADRMRTLRVAKERLDVVNRIVQKGRDAGGYPGAAVVIGRGGYAVVSKGFGTLDWTPTSPRVSPDSSIYDLASLTKVVATTSAIMFLVDDGLIDVDAPVSRYLPAFGEGDPSKNAVTVSHLLTHYSGLPAGRDLWRSARTPDIAKAQLLTTRLICPAGRCYLYSDVGADILGILAETVSGEPLDRFLATRLFEPLGMMQTQFRPARALAGRIAPTETWSRRGYPLRGEVHDENAFALGGVAGHAGLFATAADLGIFAQFLLDRGKVGDQQLISRATIERFTRRTAGHRALGWDTCDRTSVRGESRDDPTCGKLFSTRAFGHTGFTGTSLWIDPDRNVFVVLLTNRVHAARVRRPGQLIHDIRADLADAATVALLDVSDEETARRTAFRADYASDSWDPPVRRAFVPSRAAGRRAASATRARAAVTTTRAGKRRTSAKASTSRRALSKTTAAVKKGSSKAKKSPTSISRSTKKPRR